MKPLIWNFKGDILLKECIKQYFTICLILLAKILKGLFRGLFWGTLGTLELKTIDLDDKCHCITKLKAKYVCWNVIRNMCAFTDIIINT